MNQLESVDKIMYPCGCEYSFFVLDNAPHVEDDGWEIDLCKKHYTELIRRYGDVQEQREKAEIKWKEQEYKNLQRNVRVTPTGQAYI